jgi:osmoprotectant transport system permease protein
MWSDLAAHAGQHVVLALAALALALCAGIPLGVLAGRRPRLRGPSLALAGVGRTIPSLAVLMLLLPWLGVGTAPAVAALALLAIPPIVIGIEVGIANIPAPVIEAAAAMGMTPRQQFRRVIVPLALPMSFAGLRTAAVETIASATLATFVGAGGLGDDIVRGLQTDDTSILLAGAAAVAALALLTELVLSRAGRLVEARQ